MVAILDYDAGNILSVKKAFEYLGQEAEITADRETILAADHVVLPGVGSFGDAMEKLRARKLDLVIREVSEKQIPFLGVCLGLQLLFESSEESEGVPGLGILKGKICRIPDADGYKIPQIGWNSLSFPKTSVLMSHLSDDPYVYFVHSYYLQAQDPSIVAAETVYTTTMHVAVETGHVFACQFHPEKSGEVGLQILKNFLSVSKPS